MNIRLIGTLSKLRPTVARILIYFSLLSLLGLAALEGGSWLIMRYLAYRGGDALGTASNLLLRNNGTEKDNALAHDFEIWKQLSDRQYQPHLVYRNRPFKSNLVNIDARGFRLNRKDTVPHNRKPVFRFWMLGGSGTFGSTNADSATIPAFLEQALNLAPTTVPMSVLNLGVGGYTSLQVYLNFLLHLEELERPDLIIIFSGVNDYYRAWKAPNLESDIVYQTAILGPENAWKVQNVIQGRYLNRDAIVRKGSAIFRNTVKLFWEVSTWWGLREANSDLPKWSFDYRARRDAIWRSYPELTRLALSHYIDNMSAIFHVAKRRGIKVIFAQPPILITSKKPKTAAEIQEYDHIRSNFFALKDEELAKIETVTWPLYKQHRYWNFDQFLKGYVAQNAALKDFAKSVGALYVDMPAAIDAAEAIPIFSSAVHYTNEGSAYIAKLLAAKIKATKTLIMGKSHFHKKE